MRQKNLQTKFTLRNGLILGLLIGIFAVGALVATQPQLVQAVEFNANTGTDIGLSDQPLENTVKNIINWVLGLLGLIAVIIIIYAGFLWLTAAGNEDRITTAKKTILGAVIGLVIILLSYAIVAFVLEGAQGGPGGPGDDPGDDPGDGPGGGISTFYVKWKSPNDNDVNVPVCRPVQVKFNKDVTESTDNLSLINQVTGNPVAGAFTYSEDHHIFSFRADANLDRFTSYLATVPASTSSGEGDTLGADEAWVFTTSDQEDSAPPTVADTWPTDGATDVCLSTTYTVQFSEAMDALTLTEDNISITPQDPGDLQIVDVDVISETTLTFATNVPLNANQVYAITLKSGATGMKDACGNQLDGNGDGTPGDDYTWSFTTGIQAACLPEISSITGNAYYEDTLTIRGTNFTSLPNQVVFADNVTAGTSCFDGSFYPSDACISSWTNSEIAVRVPSGGGGSEGAIDGPVKVVVGTLESAPKNINVLSPHITTLNPTSGGPGQFVTINGTDFGSGGTVYFRKPGGADIPGELTTCSDGWGGTEVLIKVPEGFAVGDDVLVQIQTSASRRSNLRAFTISDQVGPGLCDIQPQCGTVDTPITLTGDGFGNDPSVFFDTTSATVSSAAEDTIEAVVPDVVDRDTPYTVTVSNDDGVSNGLEFNKPCGPEDPGGDDEVSHAACGDEQCIQISGAGADECSVDADCDGVTGVHSICSGTDCILTDGEGDNECEGPEQCQDDGSVVHAACADEQCVEISGPGTDECATNEDCVGVDDVHTVCNGPNCELAIGSGTNECVGPPQCTAGSGTSCDLTPDTPSCDPGACDAPGEVCRPSDCRCFTPPTYSCSSEQWACSADQTLCPADQACAIGCNCVGRPILSNQQPAPGATSVCRNAVLTGTFSQSMRRSSFTDQSVEVFITGGLPGGQACVNNNECRSGNCQAGACVGERLDGSFSFQNDTHDFTKHWGLLEPSTNYTVIVVGGADGVLSDQGFGMVSDVSWQFTTGPSICEINRVGINPGYRLFTDRGDSQIYEATAYYNTIPLDPAPGVYEWSWGWSSQDASIIQVAGSTTNEEVGTIQNKTGETTIEAKATVTTTGLEREVVGRSIVEVAICDNPWPANPPFVDPVTNFSTWYCRDEGLPALSETPIVGSGGDALKEFFFTGMKVCEGTSNDCSLDASVCGTAACVTLDEAVGIRVMTNSEKYSPKLWFEKRLPAETLNNPNYVPIDGYRSIRVGRTTYVGATNLASSLYANMYLMSYNENALDVTKKIHAELLKHWRFNINVGDSNLKQSLIRDLERLGNLNDVKESVSNHFSANRTFPDLAVGSYLPARSTSAWPSWQATLGNELGRRLDGDPANTFDHSGQCQQPNYHPDTCWYENRDLPEGGLFACDGDSHVLMYRYVAGSDSVPDQVELYAGLESTGWQTGSYNPCTGTNSTCACFNYQSVIIGNDNS